MQDQSLKLVKHPDGRTKKVIWFYIDAEYNVKSPYFQTQQEALDWKSTSWTMPINESTS